MTATDHRHPARHLRAQQPVRRRLSRGEPHLTHTPQVVIQTTTEDLTESEPGQTGPTPITPEPNDTSNPQMITSVIPEVHQAAAEAIAAIVPRPGPHGRTWTGAG